LLNGESFEISIRRGPLTASADMSTVLFSPYFSLSTSPAVSGLFIHVFLNLRQKGEEKTQVIIIRRICTIIKHRGLISGI
jgi:hypothetical protein